MLQRYNFCIGIAIFEFSMEIEEHPFEPFLPPSAKVLFLGTFPAKPLRWSMDFYYPNFSNDFWRIIGLVFFGDASRFEVRGDRPCPASFGTRPSNHWDKAAIEGFCSGCGLAFSDTAQRISRLKGNASDASLEVVEAQDIAGLLDLLPECKAIAATGGLASEVLAEQFGVAVPVVGETGTIVTGSRRFGFYRLPSTSRAYPLPLENKAAFYRKMFADLQFPISNSVR